MRIFALVLYASCSIVISMMYKTVLASLNFNAPFMLLTMQTAVGLAFTTFAKHFLSHVPGLGVPPYSATIAKASILSGTLFVFNIAVGFVGLRIVNVPMFLAVRRTATVFTMFGEWIILSRVPSKPVRYAVLLVLLGTIIASSESFGTEAIGYVFTLANNVLTAISLNVTRKFSDTHGVKGFGLVFYNSLVALPLAASLTLLTGEAAYTWHFPWTGAAFAAVLFASSLGVLMTYAVFLCTTVNSPLVTSVTGNAKDVVSTLVGAILFPGFKFTGRTITGLLLSFSGSGIFSYVKIREARQESQAGTSSASSHTPGAGSPAHSSGSSRAVSIESEQDKLLTNSSGSHGLAIRLANGDRGPHPATDTV